MTIIISTAVGGFIGGFVTCYAVFRKNPKLKAKADDIADVVERK